MNFAEILVWVLRLFGVGYLIGGVLMARQMYFWARIGPSVDQLSRATAEFDAEMNAKPPPRVTPGDDHGRTWWLFAGAVILALCGAAMLIGHQLAVPLLALLIVHQLLYFIRQRRRELAAPTPEAAQDARPTRAAVNGFFGGLVMAVLAGWLYFEGVLL